MTLKNKQFPFLIFKLIKNIIYFVIGKNRLIELLFLSQLKLFKN